MFLGTYRFKGDVAKLLAGYDRLLQIVPQQNLHLHTCVHDAQGIWIYDACPTRQVFESFSSSADFRKALQSAGLPMPEVTPIGEVHAAFAAGQRTH